MHFKKLLQGAALLGGSCAAFVAQAAFQIPSARGATGTIYAEWAVFADDTPAATDALIVDTTPEVGQFPSSPGTLAASVAETTGGALLSSGGNIYSPFSVLQFEVTQAAYPASSQPTTVWLQVKTLGRELDYGSLSLNGAAPDSRTELYRFTSTFMGQASHDVESLFVWNLVAPADSYEFAFAGAETSVSLDRLALDVVPVPLPPALLLLGWGIGALGLARTSRRASSRGRVGT